MTDLEKAIEELAKAKARVEANQKDLEAVQANKEDLLAEMAELEKQIEAAKKPKLRHGDYGINRLLSNHPKIAIKGNGKIRNIHPDESYGTDDLSDVLGNIFDDLTALQEDVTEFSLSDKSGIIEGMLTENNLILTDHNEEEVYISLKYLPDLILKLRQMQATMERAKK